MGDFIYFFQFLERRMRIDFRRRQAFVSQQFLHAFQTGAMIQHCRCKRMPQDMRCLLFQSADPRQVLHHPVSHRSAIQSFTFYVHEQRIVQTGHFGVSYTYIIYNGIFQLLPKRNYTLFVSLSGHLQAHRLKIHHIVVQRNEFRESDARLIEQQQYRPFADVIKTFHIPHPTVKQRLHVVVSYETGKSFFLLRSLHHSHRIFFHQSFCEGEAIKRPYCAQSSVYRCGAVSTVHHTFHPASHHITVYRLPIQCLIKGCIVFLEFLKVETVSLQRLFRVVPLILQVINKPPYRIHCINNYVFATKIQFFCQMTKFYGNIFS